METPRDPLRSAVLGGGSDTEPQWQYSLPNGRKQGIRPLPIPGSGGGASRARADGQRLGLRSQTGPMGWGHLPHLQLGWCQAVTSGTAGAGGLAFRLHVTPIAMMARPTYATNPSE